MIPIIVESSDDCGLNFYGKHSLTGWVMLVQDMFANAFHLNFDQNSCWLSTNYNRFKIYI